MGIAFNLKPAAFVMSVLLIAHTQAATLRLYLKDKLSASVDTAAIEIIDAEQGFVYIEAPGADLDSQAGQPDIPWQVMTVLLPPSADLDTVSIRLQSSQFKTIDGQWQVRPCPPAATRDENDNVVLLWPIQSVFDAEGRDASIYAENDFWPRQEVRLTERGRLHQWRLVEAAIPLVQYNPVSGHLQELLETDVVVDYQDQRDAQSKRQKEKINAKRGRNRVRELAVNFAAAAPDYDVLSNEQGDTALQQDGPAAPAGTNSHGYLIMTTSSIVNSSAKLASFVAHKQARGWNVNVVTESAWGGGTGATGAINIRNWLIANYASMDLLYVLLIGNPHNETGDVPMRWYNDGFETDGLYGAPTDALYSDLSSADGWDKYWEVVAGRIPNYSGVTALDAILQKTMDYENSIQVLWRYNALLPMVPLDDNTQSYQCGQQIKTDLLMPDSINSTRIYESDYGLTPPPEYLLSNRYPATEWAANPYGLVAWITHGWQTGATDVMTTSNVNALNDAYPSAVYEGSCQNAWPENSGNLAYRILQKGGITTVAATRNSYYTPGQSSYTSGASIGTLAYHYSKNMINTRQSCGLALAEAKRTLSLYKANATRMVLYGDPSVVVFVDPDFTPPAPDPMTWAIEPYESGTGQVTMTATTAIDNSGSGVEYYFDCVSGGGHDSGWQSSSIYVDTPVMQAVSTYRVKARDLSDSRNENGWSQESTVTIAPYPYQNIIRTIPGKIEAEYFDVGGQGITYGDSSTGNAGGQLRTLEDVDIAAIRDGKDGFAIDAIETGEWLQYTVNSLAATMDFYARVASAGEGGQITVSLNGVPLGTASVPDTGSLTTWRNVIIPGVNLPELAGAVLRIDFVGMGFRVNWIGFQNRAPYLGVPFAIPGTIDFVNYDIGGQQISYYDNTPGNGYGFYRSDDVDIMSPAEGLLVYAMSGEWLEYTCDIEPGFYTLVVRRGSSYEQRINIAQNGQTVANLVLPVTGGIYSYQTISVPDIYLSGGSDQVLRFSLNSANATLRWIQFIRQYNAADINRDTRVNLEDLSVLSAQWLGAGGVPSADIAPLVPDGLVDSLDLLLLADNWLFVE